ncbi:hypothetical protein KVR01_008131 [Diaporthe batatas]|uniref:ADP-ribose diphosphatase n=1 Tax=Diaporthe batatas TaxID=748121 RepID=UPI001D04E95D|nr:ADP-ribose diphosphatase [Diaporthe batatas]KAG8162366.1 hypothetical protein KVR01_008131 [Diaporthe batatas]
MPLRLLSSSFFVATTATRRLNLLLTTTAITTLRPFTMTAKTQEPVINSITDLAQGKHLNLKNINFTDETGKPRVWEVAGRANRSATAGVDAVSIGNILLPPPSQKSTRPASTILVVQYRPPLDAYTVEWPAGLIDPKEDVETAALRELKEETGYEASRVLSVSPPQAADPGMSSATVQLVMVEVQLPEGCDGADGELAMPPQKLDDGEHIERVVVPLADLYGRLVEYAGRERHVVAAKLFHFAQGMEFMKGQKYF